MKRLEFISSTKLLLLAVGLLAVTFMTLAVDKADMEETQARMPQGIMAAPSNITPASGNIVLPSGRQIAAAELFNAAGQPYFDHLFFLNDYNKQTIVFSGPFDTYSVGQNASGEWQVTPLTTYANNGVETTSKSDTYYYGYHKIKRTRTYNLSQTKKATRSGSSCSGYTYSGNAGSIEPASKTVKYTYLSTTGSVSPSLASTAKPADELTTAPSSFSEEDMNSWDCSNWECVYEKSSNQETRSGSKTVTDYLYIWARINGSVLDNNGLAEDAVVDGGGFMTDKDSDTSTKKADASCYLISGTGSAQSATTTISVPTRLTRHILVIETNGSSYTTKADYQDITNYSPSYSTSTTNTNASYNDAVYHDYGANGASVEMLTNMTNKTDVVATMPQASGIWYYQKNGNKYTLTSGEYNTPNAAITGKIYITGENHRLNAGTTGDGWLQPQNADIYLDGVSMQCASKGAPTSGYTVTGNSTAAKTYTTAGITGTYKKGGGTTNHCDKIITAPTTSQATYLYREYPDNYRGGTPSALKDKDTVEVVHGSAAVFFLIEGSKATASGVTTYGDNNTTIHLRGENYIAGQEGRTICVNVRAWLCAATARCISANQEVTVASPPIQMKDYREFFTYAPQGTYKQTWVEHYSESETTNTDYIYPWRVDRDPSKSNVPNINCSFDNQWINEEINENAYLDLTASQTFSRYHNNDEAAYNSTATYRFAPPLYTGGQNCKYIINGGHINLWPADGYSNSFSFPRNLVVSKQSVGVTVAGVGKYANYLLCGSSKYEMNITGSSVSTSIPTILAMMGGFNMSDINLQFSVHGFGSGYPVGSLIVNGGTISTVTDPNSFANAGKENIGNSGTILASNIQINGGSFRTNTVKSITDPTAHLAVEGATNALPSAKRIDPKNKFNETLSRTPITTDPEGASLTANHDYSDTWASEPLMNRGIDKKGWLIKKGTEYIYGTNMIADASGKAYYYLPASYTSQAKVKNYILDNEDQTIASSAALTANPAWIVTLYDGEWNGSSLVQNYAKSDQVAITTKKGVRYIRPITATGSGYMDSWFGLYFPFGIQKITEGMDYAINAYVPGKDNSNSWFYMYHFDGTDIAGTDDAFTAHQLPNSTPSGTMSANTAYMLQFPDDYWNTSTVMFHSADAATLPASSTALTATTAPTAANTFRLGGNKTATTKTLAKGYVLDAEAASGSAQHAGTTEDFVYVENYTLKPFQMYLLASDATYGKYLAIGRKFIMRDNTNLVDMAESHTLKAFGTKGFVHVVSSQNEVVRIYGINGQLICEERTEPETVLLLPMVSGLYLVVGESDNIKVRVD